MKILVLYVELELMNAKTCPGHLQVGFVKTLKCAYALQLISGNLMLGNLYAVHMYVILMITSYGKIMVSLKRHQG